VIALFPRGFIKQGVGFAVEHTVTLLDGSLADGLSQVTFTGAGWPQKQSIFMTGDEAAGGEIEDQAASLGDEWSPACAEEYRVLTKVTTLAPAGTISSIATSLSCALAAQSRGVSQRTRIRCQTLLSSRMSSRGALDETSD
jgi:hypothetical protein